MDFNKMYEKIDFNSSLAKKAGFNPYYNVLQTGLGEKIQIDGRDFINLASNNYLGLANDTRVKDGVIKAVDKYGASLCGTPVATGYIDLLKRVEDNLADFLHLDAAILLPSCYQANNGLFTAVAGKDDIILVDRFAHSSLVQGIMSVGCKIRPFFHNDMEHLKGILEKSSSYKNIFVVTESVFSTEGSIAPLKDITKLCEKYNAMPVVDDSHGIGVIGRSGRGILEDADIKSFNGIYTASLGKAFANLGGIIAGEKGLIEYLRYYCSHLVYSTALPPSVLGGIEITLDIIKNDFASISKKMWNYKDLLNNALQEAGFEVCPGRAPINSISTGSLENTLLTTKKFFDNGILSTPFVEPSVPPNSGKVRFIAGANLSAETLENASQIIRRIGSV